MTGSGKTFTIAKVDRGRQPADPRSLAQQDARGPALPGVPELLSRELGRVLRVLLRLLPARGLRARRPTRTSRRRPPATRRSTSCDWRRRRRSSSGATSSSSRRSRASTASARPTRTTTCWPTSRSATTQGMPALLARLVEMQYERTNLDLARGSFRVRGDVLEIQPAYEDTAVRVEFFGDEIEKITRTDPLRGTPLQRVDRLALYPAHLLRDAARDARAGDRLDPPGARRADGRADAGRPAARGPAPPPAHDVRPRDDEGARLLQRHRELLAPPLRPARRGSRRRRCSTTSRRTSCSSSTSRT